MNTLIISPAYGRDYKSKLAALTDFHDNKDFMVESINSSWCGKLCNKDSIKRYSPEITHVEIRYSKLRKLVIEEV